jgi:dUTP pyrophosphatase
MKRKRYYTVGEKVFVKATKNFGIIKELKINPSENVYKVVVEEKTKTETKIALYDLWEIDKDKSDTKKMDVLFFAKTSPTAIIPSKRKEDAGYDIYADVGDEDIRLKVGRPTSIPTGIATAFPSKYYLNFKHERGSTGKIGLSVLSGVIDSGYRNEIFVCLCATYKDVILTRDVKEVTYRDDEILYPLSKAVCQATLDIVPRIEVEEISYEQLQTFTSERGMSHLGASGK